MRCRCASGPVVTLTGVGGVGKTRLALEVAERMASGYRDGAWLCKLEGVRHGDAVPDAVLEVFGVDPGHGGNAVATLIRFLGSKHLVLELDNCEHLLRPAARLIKEVVDAWGEVTISLRAEKGSVSPASGSSRWRHSTCPTSDRTPTRSRNATPCACSSVARRRPR